MEDFSEVGKVYSRLYLKKARRWKPMVRVCEISRGDGCTCLREEVRCYLDRFVVNLPKFSRKETHKPELGGERKNEQARMTWRQKNPPRTFAHVVRDDDESASKKTMDNSVVCFQVAVESTKWLEECFVGRLIELKNVMSIKESFFLSGINSVKLRSLGEKFVLLSCDEAGLLEEIVAGNKDLLDRIFESIVPWDDSFAVGEKFIWVRCRGIPLALWSNQCFESIGSLVSALVEVDNATVTREVVEFARLRVRIPVGSDTRMVKQVQINSTFCNVSFEEESEVSLAMQRLLDHQWGRVCEEESEASLDECGEGSSVNSLELELGEGFVSKEGEEETVQLPAEVKGSMLGGDGDAWKNIYCGI